ncbi:MAG: ABC transporter ATP-binding protein [Gammaproteobacteria bacterium]|nr:ABC transporter ATP-binding protein [Gammaproteobacteria bacterium]
MDNNELIIDVKNLTKSFDKKLAVNQVSLEVKKGEIFGFLGPNGAGKTTTIRMLCGLLTPDGGEGTCLGFNVLKESYSIKKQVGYMTQFFSLYNDLSIEENLHFVARLYGVKDRKNRVTKSIEQLGLQHRRNQLAGTLSGGWKQRLALSAALIHDPKLLLLDEPTAGVDPKARREFWAEIQKLSHQGITTLVSTHYMDEAERCSKLAYIFDGKIMAKGRSEEIVNNAELTTWHVAGQGDLVELAKTLTSVEGVDQVTQFGNKLHVSGKNTELLEKNLQQFYSDDWVFTKVASSLEDVFISFCTVK